MVNRGQPNEPKEIALRMPLMANKAPQKAKKYPKWLGN